MSHFLDLMFCGCLVRGRIFKFWFGFDFSSCLIVCDCFVFEFGDLELVITVQCTWMGMCVVGLYEADFLWDLPTLETLFV